MVRREIDGSKACYWSSMGREYLRGNKLKGGEEERREGGGKRRREEKARRGGEGRRGEKITRIRVHVHVHIGHTFHPNLFSSSLLPDNDTAVHSP